MDNFYSNGKLLLTGEYAILDGALGLALPTKFGQRLEVSKGNDGLLAWKSYTHDHTIWLDVEYSLPNLEVNATNNLELALSLYNILAETKKLNPDFLGDKEGFFVETHLSFPNNWGLGSSSTLINNIAQWAKVDPYLLLKHTFGGSGYDIACAQHNNPILYHLEQENPMVEAVTFAPPFKDSLYFVHLNRKQNSREAIRNYRKRWFDKKDLLPKINAITKKMAKTQKPIVFEQLIHAHELLLSNVLGIAPVKEQFPDYFGSIKSLGAWGGDFILATGNEKTPDYFKARGFDTVLPYGEMIL